MRNRKLLTVHLICYNANAIMPSVLVCVICYFTFSGMFPIRVPKTPQPYRPPPSTESNVGFPEQLNS
ncbi:hypothetical protein BJY00DRAFT_255616 [Aspergillus carlsbadensis]|nr:hypothetical protein BJY00DRAFT_255616 [Aspergillus carlsbadensis]